MGGGGAEVMKKVSLIKQCSMTELTRDRKREVAGER